MKCLEDGCDGTVGSCGVSVRTSCATSAVAHPCEKCGRLHWLDKNTAVFNRAGAKAFYIDDQLVNKTA